MTSAKYVTRQEKMLPMSFYTVHISTMLINQINPSAHPSMWLPTLMNTKHATIPHNIKQKTFLSYTLWGIWILRNHNLFTNTQKWLTLKQITSNTLEFIHFTARYHQPKLTHNAKWLPPPQSYYKLNTDGAVRNSNHQAGIGGVIRDCHGNLVVGFAGNYNHATIYAHWIVRSLPRTTGCTSICFDTIGN